MIDVPVEKQIILYECVIETAQILEFETFIRVFYCGTRLKWSTPNALLIVIEEDQNNRFYQDMSCEGGCTGSAYLNKPYGASGPWAPDNKHHTFHYKVITDRVYDALNNDWAKLADESWLYPKNNKYIPGIDITETIQRHYDLRIFS